MLRWSNKVAVVTGASSGIGAAIATDLLKNGLNVIGLARRVDRIEEIRNNLQNDEHKSRFYPLKCDVTIENEVQKTFKTICEKFGGVDILINNAGLLQEGYLSNTNSSIIRKVLDTNVMSIVYCTREAFQSMKERDVNGHVVLINSIAGHKVMGMSKEVPPFNIYAASKFAVTAMTEIYRQEFNNLDTKVKITSVSPGLVRTEMTSDKILETTSCLDPKDIADAVSYCISTPPHVQIHELTIKMVGEF